MLDPHCHLDDPSLEPFLDEVFQRSAKAGLRGVLVPGYGPERWNKQEELLLSRKLIDVWGAFGLHPWALQSGNDIQATIEILEQGFERALGWGKKLVAVGEFGLERSRKITTPLTVQSEIFGWHLEKAKKFGLPVILHLVRSDGKALDLLQAGAPWRGVVHGFSSHSQTVPHYLALGLYLSFGSALLHSDKARAALKATPLERVMFETDAPAGLKGNFSPPRGPHQLQDIFQAASQILGKSVKYLLARHQENCREVFRLSV